MNKSNLSKIIYFCQGVVRIATVALLANSQSPYLVDKKTQKDIDEATKYNKETDKELEKLL